MSAPERFDSRAILYPAARDVKFHLTRHAPADDIAFFVDRYWIVRWDLPPGETHPQETLPQPSAHLVFRRGHSALHGVMTSRFHIVLEGKGQGFGVKFKPGGFAPFLGRDLAEITDRDLALEDVLGPGATELEARILAIEDDRAQIDLFESYLRPRLPDRDPNVPLVAGIIATALADRDVTRVEHLAERSGIAPRALQRLFKRYVGVSPKWVIRRARMNEAADRVARREAVSWADLASELGYFDQAHFIRDFRAQIGRSPADYAAACEALAERLAGA